MHVVFGNEICASGEYLWSFASHTSNWTGCPETQDTEDMGIFSLAVTWAEVHVTLSHSFNSHVT